MGSPKSPCFLGEGRTATRGQGIPTGVAFRVRRVRTQASRASGCPPRRPSPLWLALPQVCGKASLFGRWLLSPTRRGVLGAPIGCSDTITGQKPGPTTHIYSGGDNYCKQKEKSNDFYSINRSRKERNDCKSEAGSDELDRLSNRVFTQNYDQSYRFIRDPC